LTPDSPNAEPSPLEAGHDALAGGADSLTIHVRGDRRHMQDADAFRPFRTGLACVVHARAQDPRRFAWRTAPYEFVKGIPAFDLLCGSERERRAIEAGAGVRELARGFAGEERAFARRRRPYLRYGE
jgi:uncharacterized protein YbbC (DUF1343 family)